MIKPFCLFILSFLVTVSCQKDDLVNSFPPEVSFDISQRLLEGQPITCIDFDRDGNAYIGSGTMLFHSDGNDLKNYDIGSSIIDLAVAPDQTVWIGTKDSGLCHLTGEQLEYYTTENAGLPRDLVMNVEAAPDGKIWFASCAHLLGGLGIYDGRKFTFLTPENSPLNQNIIADIEIDDEGSVYIATAGTVGRTNIYRIRDNSWECLGNEEGTFYWVFSFTISPSGTIYLVEDFSLSSSFRTNRLLRLEDDEWENIDLGDDQQISFFSAIKADKRDYCWLTTSRGNGLVLYVYNGKSCVSSPQGLITGNIITAIETDNENNIWIGTYTDGIFILNQ